MTPPPEAIIRVWAPFAPRFSDRVWRHAQGWLRGAMLAPGAGTGTTALRVMGLSAERRGTHSHRVLNRAVWSARHGSRRRLGRWLTLRVPPAATMVLGADDTVERRSGRQSRATGCDRDAVRASHTQVSRCFGLTWGSMRRLVPVPWRQRGWARPGRTVWCWPANTPPPRRHHPSVAGVRQRRPQGRRGRPGRRWVLVGAGGVAAVSLALAGVKPPVVMAARWRWAAALEPPPAPQPPGQRGPHPPTGKRQRRLPGGADRADTPWETVAVAWDSGQRQRLWGVARPAWWSTPKWPPVAVRFGLGGDPAGPLRMAACFGPDLQATPVQVVPWVVRRWCVEGTCEAGRAHLGRETQRPWSDQALARTPPGLLALFSLVTRLALQLSHGGPMPVAGTAWYHQPEPTVVECLAWVRRHLWRAQYVVHAAAAPAFVQFPRKALEGLLTGLSLAA